MASHDIIFFGDSAPVLCVAAYAGALGLDVGLIASGALPSAYQSELMPPIPNTVWRKLDLQDDKLVVSEALARVTLHQGHSAVATAMDVDEAAASIMDRNEDDGRVWPDFQAQMALSVKSGAFQSLSVHGTKSNGHGPSGLVDYAPLAMSCSDVLDDYFDDEALKAHLAAHAMASGMGCAEAGSMIQLQSMVSALNAPVRLEQGAKNWRALFKKKCSQFDVQVYDGDSAVIEAPNGRRRVITLNDGSSVSGKCLFFVTGEVANAFGVSRCTLGHTAFGIETATASVRLRLRSRIDALEENDTAIFQISHGREQLQHARDQALTGRLPEHPPVEFEFLSNGDILARSRYFPKLIADGDSVRTWSGQDKQVAGTRIRHELEAVLPSLREVIARMDVKISTNATKDRALACERMIIQLSSFNAVAQSVALVDQVHADG